MSEAGTCLVPASPASPAEQHIFSLPAAGILALLGCPGRSVYPNPFKIESVSLVGNFGWVPSLSVRQSPLPSLLSSPSVWGILDLHVPPRASANDLRLLGVERVYAVC